MADFDKTAAASFDAAAARILTDNSVSWDDVWVDLPLGHTGSRGWTPLMCACRTRNHALVKAMLDAGADPNRTNATGTTPLMFAKTVAFASGDLSIMDLLIDAGAVASATDKHGLTARQYTEQRSAMVAAYLKEKETR